MMAFVYCDQMGPRFVSSNRARPSVSTEQLAPFQIATENSHHFISCGRKHNTVQVLRLEDDIRILLCLQCPGLKPRKYFCFSLTSMRKKRISEHVLSLVQITPRLLLL